MYFMIWDGDNWQGQILAKTAFDAAVQYCQYHEVTDATFEVWASGDCWTATREINVTDGIERDALVLKYVERESYRSEDED